MRKPRRWARTQGYPAPGVRPSHAPGCVSITESYGAFRGARAAGAVTGCAAQSPTGPGLATFDVTFVDAQGNFTVTWPDGRLRKGNSLR